MTTVKLSDYPDSIYARTICQCSDNGCDLDISFDVDPVGHLELGFQLQLKSCGDRYYNQWFWVDWWWRVKTAVKILLFGEVKADHFILLNDKAVREFRDTIEGGIQQVEAYWAEKDKKKEKA